MNAVSRALRAAAIVCALGTVGPGAASAANWEGSLSGSDTLFLSGGDVVTNKNFQVSATTTQLLIKDFSSTPGSATGACTYAAFTVSCPGAGVTTVFAGLGPGNDMFTTNTSLEVVVFGNAGNDTISGNTGVDLLVGADGNDTLNGGGGKDVLTDGAQLLFGDSGASGNDVMHGDGDDDLLDAGFGSSALNAATRAGGRDTLDGGSGTDTIDYSQRTAPLTITESSGAADDGELGEQDTVTAAERILGGSAADHITGGAGLNTLEGRDGADLLEGGGGADTLLGGAGDDVLDGGPAGDALSGSTGADTATYAARTQPVTVTLDDVGSDGEAGENDNAGSDVENVTGGGGADVISGSGTANGLTGGVGDDALNGLGGDDSLDGGDGNDTLDGGTGSDAYAGGPGADTILARDDSPDTISCGADADTVTADTQDTVAADCETVSRPAVAGGGGTGGGGGGTGGGGTGGPGGGPGPVKDLVGPRLSIALNAAATASRARITVTVTCPKAEPAPCRSGRVALTFKRGKRTIKAGSATFATLKPGQKRRLAIAVPRSARPLLGRLRRLAATATAKDAAGNTGKAARTIVLPR
jgi:Ca2+-binding RTX toxin-like protein